ncbi:hypothetical protein BST26_20300 [Mycolicibacterium insubricum]|uniref:Excalibur calcium-binding domain-containing protein n=1 Tax=Mycolicibacterium insubricum TaxID=444597 RepID=A0A1X0CUI7_9MYCO|nr:hypothetical protein BST26_20300 [Mycolicibacterium insubricum]
MLVTIASLCQTPTDSRPVGPTSGSSSRAPITSGHRSTSSVPRTTVTRPSGKPTCRDLGRTDIPRGDPDYAPWLDGDGDGIACESRKPR